jgi:hypothetical protein
MEGSVLAASLLTYFVSKPIPVLEHDHLVVKCKGMHTSHPQRHLDVGLNVRTHLITLLEEGS